MNAKFFVTATLIAAVAGSATLADGSRGRSMPTFDFSAADADASGGITRDEFTAYLQVLQGAAQTQRAAAMVEAGDTDGDGLLSAAELEAALASAGDQMRSRLGERGERGERSERGERRERGEGRAQAQAGEDGAQRQGGDRRERGMARMFDRIDANSDGSIDAEELAQAQAHMQERMQRRSNG